MIIKGPVKEWLRKELFEIGFDEVRFAELDPPIPNRLNDWVGKGYHADMDWFARSLDKRIDPKRVLDSACSAIMLGTNYWPTDSSAARQSRWAKYSLYKDYHDTILKGLKRPHRFWKPVSVLAQSIIVTMWIRAPFWRGLGGCFRYGVAREEWNADLQEAR